MHKLCDLSAALIQQHICKKKLRELELVETSCNEYV